MTETAKTIIDVTTVFARWVASHINVGGEIVRQLVFLGVLFGYITLTPDQQIGLMQAVSGIAAALTGASVISKVRMGERIEEKVEAKVEARVAQITGTGTGG
jgi:hypothetical protein